MQEESYNPRLCVGTSTKLAILLVLDIFVAPTNRHPTLPKLTSIARTIFKAKIHIGVLLMHETWNIFCPYFWKSYTKRYMPIACNDDSVTGEQCFRENCQDFS